PKTTTTTTTTTTTSTSSSTAAKPSPGKGPTKQDSKKADAGKPKDAGSSSVAGKAAATTVASSSKPKEEVSPSVAGKAAITTVGAAAVGAAAVKEEKKVSVDKISAATTPSKEKDDALDLLIDSLGGPESVPESPKFTGPEIADTPATSEYLEELGKRESTIPPEYRHLLDDLGDDDLIAAMSSEFVSSPAPPQEKKPKLEEKKEAQKASTAPIASSKPQSIENIKSTYVEELGKRDSSIPPEYRHLLDGKDHGKPLPVPAAKLEPALTDMDVLDELSKDFEFSPPSPAQPSAPPAAVAPKDTTQDKQAKADVVVPSSASSVQAATAPSAGMDMALDELIGTLEGPEFNAPESPAYTGPEVTGKAGEKPAVPPPEEKPMTESELADELDFTCSPSPVVQKTPPAKPKDAELKKAEPESVVSATSSSSVQATPSKAPTCKADPLDALSGTLGVRKEDPKDKKPAADTVKEQTGKEKKDKLGEDEKTIPPDYRLKEVKAMSEDDLLDALDEGFVTSPAVSQCPPLKSSEKPSQKSGSEEIVSCSKVSSVQSSAPKPPSAQSGDKKPSDSIPDDALDLLSGSLGTRIEDPDEKKPVVDLVKEKAKKEHIDRLGDRDDTIPPEYRHLLDGKDQGKPAKPEEVKPKASLSDDAAIDALSGGFSLCDTGSADKAKSSSKDKTGTCTSSTPVSKTAEKTPDASKV
ncbi:hypothetical protein AB205_0199290, partial [Aquarana catesbeiana]